LPCGADACGSADEAGGDSDCAQTPIELNANAMVMHDLATARPPNTRGLVVSVLLGPAHAKGSISVIPSRPRLESKLIVGVTLDFARRSRRIGLKGNGARGRQRSTLVLSSSGSICRPHAKRKSMASFVARTCIWCAAVALTVPAPLTVAEQQTAAPAVKSTPQSAQQAPFKQEELEQLVAPIALYPDALLAQVLMASTYPIEVVQAARWAKSNPTLTVTALENAMQNEPWDPSVKALTAVPQVLEMMEQKLDWTHKLGDAFLGQQSEVMQAVQRLRAKASAAGHLQSGKEQTVTTKQEGGETVIVIEPANPEVIYVPTYDPAYVYGTWPYPAYPPYYWYPPGYYYPGGAFLAGIVIGAWLWGGCNWGGGGGGVYVDHHRYNNFNRTNISDRNWRHNVEHRKGVAYRDQATASRFDRDFSRNAQAREQFRGRAEQGRAEIQRGDLGGRLDSTSFGNRGAFDGVGNSAATRDISNRGNASRESMGRTGRGFSGGGGRMGGGGRGGGGRR